MDAAHRLGQRRRHREHVSLPCASPAAIGTVLVQTISSTSGSRGEPLEGAVGEQPVGAGDPDRAGRPRSRSRSSSSTTVLPLAISSSRTMTSLPATSPMIALISTRSSANRCLAPGGDRRRRAAGRTRPPPWRCRGRARRRRCWRGRSRRKCAASSRSACRWSTGTLKKPCTCGECSVMASTRFGAGRDQQVGDQPAADRDARGVLLVASGRRRSAASPRSSGPADAPRAASSISSSSTRCSWTGGTSGWMRKTSRSRQLRLELHLEAVVGEPGERVGSSGTPEVSADLGGELRVGGPAEDGDVAHGRHPTDGWVASASRRPGSDLA